MSIPFSDSNSTTNANINLGIQPSSDHGLPSTSPVEEAADEPPSSRKQTPLFPVTITHESIQLTASTSTTKTDPSVEKQHGIILTSEKLRDIEAQNGTGTPRKIRFQMPMTLPRLSKRSRLRALFTPHKPVGPAPSYARSFVNILKFSPLNVLLAFIPISWALHFSHQSDTIVFVTSALAIMPLAALLGFGTEQIAVRTSSAVAALLNASLGNLTELIIAGICLSRCELALVQSTLLGGLLSNLLLVLGSAFIVGGFKYPQLSFRPAAAQLNASLLTVGVFSLVVPTAFHIFLGGYFPDSSVEGPILLKLSRGYAVILIFMYCSYLGFQFYTHSHLFVDVDMSDADSHHASWGGSSDSSDNTSTGSSRSSLRSRRSSAAPTATTAVSEILRTQPSAMIAHEEVVSMPIHPLTPITTIQSVTSDSSVETIHYPLINTPAALIMLGAITAMVYLTAENLVDSLTGLTEKNPNGISREFLSLIVLPVLSNGAELSTAVYAGFKGKFDLVLGVAVGSCTQITLLVIPLLICVAWGMGKPLGLLFDPMETTCIFLTVLFVKFVIEDGRTHWLNGLTLVCVYIMIASTFWHFPTNLMGLLGGNQTLFICNN